MKQYYPELDVIKGITILIVMMAYCQSDELMIPTTINYVLQSFSIPLFIMASGFLFNPNDTWSKFFKKKSARLLAPYLIVSLISYALKSVKDYLKGGNNYRKWSDRYYDRQYKLSVPLRPLFNHVYLQGSSQELSFGCFCVCFFCPQLFQNG